MSKVAIVTGASSGIGLAVAKRWAERGGRVALVARTKRTLDEAKAEIGDAAEVFPLDVSDMGLLTKLPAEVVARFGRLDVVVNNAGFNRRGPIDQFAAACGGPRQHEDSLRE